MNKKGSIVIITLWILAILSLLAIGVGFRMGLEIKLTGYQASQVKALYLAKAGMQKVIAVKWMEYLEGESIGIDAMSQPWSNDEENFLDLPLGDGKFTLSYKPKELDRTDKEIVLYGMQDEYARININKDKMSEPFQVLLMDKGLALDDTAAIAASIKDWCDKDDIASPNGAEDEYYQGLDKPYYAGNTDFRAVEELLLVKGITEGIFYGEDKNENGKIEPEEEGIADVVTVFGDGNININTAPEAALRAVFGVGFPELAKKIVNYRQGFDGKIGSSDDRWFASGSFAVHRGSLGMVEIKNLNDDTWSGNIFGITAREWSRIKDLAKGGVLVTSSDVYRINVTGQARKVKKKVVAVVKFNKPKALESVGIGFEKKIEPPNVEFLFWHEE